MSNAPLMPKATAIWLVENTSLTFDQIANFCKLHPLEVKGIADGEVGAGIRGADPITSGQLTREAVSYTHLDVYKRQGLDRRRRLRNSLHGLGKGISCSDHGRRGNDAFAGPDRADLGRGRRGDLSREG